MTNPGSAVYLDEWRVYARNLEVPSGGGVGTARGIAHAYSVFANGGRELGLRQETLDLLAAPAIPPTRGFYDECMKADGIQFSLGFMKSTAAWPFGSARSFGSPGAGGSLGFADPEAGIGYAYVTSQMGTAIDRRSEGCRAQSGALLRSPEPARVAERFDVLQDVRRVRVGFRGRARGIAPAASNARHQASHPARLARLLNIMLHRRHASRNR